MEEQRFYKEKPVSDQVIRITESYMHSRAPREKSYMHSKKSTCTVQVCTREFRTLHASISLIGYNYWQPAGMSSNWVD